MTLSASQQISSAHVHAPVSPLDDVYEEGLNVARLVKHWATIQGDTPALIQSHGDNGPRTPKRMVSFADLNQRINHSCHAFHKAGLRPGDRIGLFVTDGIEFVTLVYAFQRLGAVPVLIDPGMGVKNLLACVEEQSLKGFVGIPKAHILRTVFGKAFRSVTVPILVGGNFFPGTKTLDSLINKVPTDLLEQPYAEYCSEPSDPATIVYTSGSTGIPKGVVYTHRMMAGQVKGVEEVGGFRPQEIHMACFPGFALYALGIGMTTVFPVMNFTKPGKANPDHILHALESHQVQSAFASPALWERFSRHIDAQNIELSNLRACFASGAAVQPALLRRLVPKLPKGDFFTPYGATESLPVAYMGGKEILEETAARTAKGAGTCVGRIANGMRVKIIEVTDDAIASMDEANVLSSGEIGEIAVAGSVVTEVYDQRPKHTALAKIRDDDGTIWHRMGDVGYLDEQGLLWFCGRKSHRVETAGGTLYSVPCEAIFETDQRVFRAALTWTGERPHQTPVICIELHEGITDHDNVLNALRQIGGQSALTKEIEHILIHPAFPVDRRHNAKIEREKLSQWVTERRS